MVGTQSEGVSLDAVVSILAESGYDVTQHRVGTPGAGTPAEGGLGENEPESVVLRIQDPESRVVLRGVLVGEILYLTISCVTLPQDRVTPELMRRLLSAENGISTSAFQLYERGDGSVAVTLNNFCKLMAMGDDDADDILSCVEFLMADVLAAREIVGDAAG